MAKRLSNIFIDKYKRDNLEDSGICFYDEPQSKTSSYFYDELENQELEAFPMGCELVKEDGSQIKPKDIGNCSKETLAKARLRYYYLPYFHEIYIGTTGSGQTTGCIEPQIRALGKQKNKPNLFITDPKGELFMHHSRFLKEEGYNIYILNFKDVYHSHYLNFLEEPYDEFQKLKNLPIIAKNAKKVKGYPEQGIELRGPKEKFDGKEYILADNKAFPTVDDLKQYLTTEEFNIKARVSSLVADIASDMIPENFSEKDRTWSDGARGLLRGIISLLLHCSIKDKDFKKEYFNLKTINDTYTLFVQGSLCQDQIAYGDNSYASAKEYKMMNNILKYMKGDDRHFIDNVITTASATRKGFLSTFESAMAKWMQAHIFQITSATTVDIDHDEDHPFAIFFATRDYAKGDFEVAGIFIDYVYRFALLKADRSPRDENNNPTTRTLHFLLDEFGNIPAIPNFQTKISTARSRKIYFHLFLQSYQQLEAIYGPLNGKIIVDNCNQEMFIGSQNFDTKETFSKKCGSHAVETVSSTLERRRIFEQNRIVQLSDLEEIKPGEMYIKRYNSPVIKTSFIRSYILANTGHFPTYYDEAAFTEVAPTNYKGLQTDEITYTKVCIYKDDSLDYTLPEELGGGKPSSKPDDEEREETDDKPISKGGSILTKPGEDREAPEDLEEEEGDEDDDMVNAFRKLVKGGNGGNHE